MNAHWSENDSVELLRISINNYPKFVHLKKNNEPDKFFDDRIFSKFHNLGRNGKSIKNRIETVQKKFRKTVRSMDINKFKEGIIEGDCYKTPETIELFNTSFEFERLFGKYCGSKELMRIIEVVCRSDYWTNNRKRIHPRWNKRLSLSNSTDENSISSKVLQTNQNTIVISSAESSGSDDLSSFKDIDFVVQRKRKFSRDSNLSSISKERIIDDNDSLIIPKVRLLDGSLSTDLDNDCTSMTIDKISISTQTDEISVYHQLMVGASMMTDVLDTSDQNCATDNEPKRLTFSEMMSTDVTPLKDLVEDSISRTITATFGPMVSALAGIHNTLIDISESLRQRPSSN